jgi:uncharacterized protein YjiS (DUF1127 family)
MLHADAISHRFGHPVASRHLVERGRALLRHACRAAVTAWTARRETPPPVEISDHLLKDIGIGRDDIRHPATTRDDERLWGANQF